MYELRSEKPLFYRVKEGQAPRDISLRFRCPVRSACPGEVIVLPEGDFIEYRAHAGDSFSSVAQAFGVSGEELEALNGGHVYPSRRLYVPAKR